MTQQDPFRNPWFCDAASWAAGARSTEAATAIRQLLELGNDQASLARLFASNWQGAAMEGAARLQREFAERYRQLFGPVLTMSAAAPVAAQTELALRYQSALQRHGALLAGIAQDAAGRFTTALAAGAGPPITSLRELHAIWIDCGEQAFAEAAHGEAFAAAQAELLAAWVDWRAVQVTASGGTAPG